ncbi:MAG: SDR family oxidoreductase [bacterium]|nr:SDR family oxidoreductase [bacterium]
MIRTVLITGAGTGIGKVCAHELMRAGYHVLFTGRRLDVLQEALSEGEGSGEVLACDISDADGVSSLFATIEKTHGRLDVLFNNAGIFNMGKLIDEISVEEWRRTVDINLTGSFLCARAAFSLMRRQDPMGGRIINNGSISAYVPRPGSVPYSATKHAMTGLTKCLSLDGRPFDIACSQIDIGNAASDMALLLEQGAKQANGDVLPEPLLGLQHVADAVRYMADLPLSANVQFMTVMATKMPYVGRG